MSHVCNATASPEQQTDWLRPRQSSNEELDLCHCVSWTGERNDKRRVSKMPVHQSAKVSEYKQWMQQCNRIAFELHLYMWLVIKIQHAKVGVGWLRIVTKADQTSRMKHQIVGFATTGFETLENYGLLQNSRYCWINQLSLVSFSCWWYRFLVSFMYSCTPTVHQLFRLLYVLCLAGFGLAQLAGIADIVAVA